MKLSIILPVYNVEDYLEKCITSLVNQKFKDVEFIFVDDESTDNSLSILKQWENIDYRIRVYSKKNEGSGIARNFGLQRSNSEYIYFMDPDDWIEPNFLEDINYGINTNPAEVILFGYKIYDNGNYVKEKKSDKTQFLTFSKINKKIYNEIFNQITLFQVWNKVYNKNFLLKNNLLFTNQRTGQDAIFNIDMIKCAKKILILDKSYYNYNIFRKGSAQSRYDRRKIFDNINIASKFEKFCKSINYIELSDNYFVSIFFEDLMNHVRNKDYPFWLDEEIYLRIIGIKIKNIDNFKSKFKLFTIKIFPKKFYNIVLRYLK